MASPPPHKRARHRLLSTNDRARPDPAVPLSKPSDTAATKARTIRFRYRPNEDSYRLGPDEAFRDLLKRWKEDIVKTHNLSEGQFAVVPQTIGDGGARQVYYRVIAPASEPKRYLGHLRYAAQDGEGVVELVTKGVRLDLGGEESASRGGAPESKIPYESLETAILVLMSSPQNNRVRIRTGLFDWRFNFNKQASLVAVRQRFPPEEARDIQRQILESGATCDSESSEAWPGKDTQLIFGEPGKAHDEHGNPTTRAQVTEHDFESWTKTALFLQDMPEDARIHTLNGDIILLPALAGRLYYDELLLHSRDSSKHRKKPLKYAYNFPRRSPFIKDDLVLSSDAQAKAIMAIWNRAVSLHPKLVKQLSDMLSDAEVEFDDVVGAEAYLAQKPASLLRKHLLMYSPGNVWFYSPQEKAMDPDLLAKIQNARCVGRELTPRLWAIMAKFALLTTVDHGLHKRVPPTPPRPAPRHFEAASPHFRSEVARLSQACIRLCPPVEDYAIVFVQNAGPGLLLSVDHESGAVKIPYPWLDKDRMTAYLEMPGGLAEPDMILHTVYTIFTKLLEICPDEHVKAACDPAEPGARRTKRGFLSDIHLRLLSYVRACTQIRIHHYLDDAKALILSASALPETGWARAGDVIELELHAMECSHAPAQAAGDEGGARAVSLSDSSGRDLDVQSIDLTFQATPPPYQTCQKAVVECPASTASYMYAKFSRLRAGETYFALATNKSDPDALQIALEGCLIPEELSPAQRREAELANGRHCLASWYLRFTGWPQPADGSMPPENWAVEGTFMIE